MHFSLTSILNTGIFVLATVIFVALAAGISYGGYLWLRRRPLLFGLYIALECHVLLILGMWIVQITAPVIAQEKLLTLTAIRKEIPPPPKDEPEAIFELPKGRMDIGDKNVQKIRKGDTMEGKKVGDNDKQAVVFGNQRTIVGADGAVTTINDPDAGGDPFGGGNTMDPFANTFGEIGGGEEGANIGDPNGEGDGIPVGFKNGTIGGKVITLTFKHGGVSNPHRIGINNLMTFIKSDVGLPVEPEEWPRDWKWLSRNINKDNGVPPYIYLYVDSGFDLTPEEANTLQRYMDKGGFLFIDSKPTPPAIRNTVAKIVSQVTNQSLEKINSGHAINSFQYELSSPAYGKNIVDPANYGVTKNGRLCVFYTPGSFADIFTNNQSTDAIWRGTYQMAVNVIMYAISRGDSSEIRKKAGAETIVKIEDIPTYTAPVQSTIPVPTTTDGTATVSPPESPDDIKF